MIYVVGLVLFALGILASLLLHEAGHFFTARAFGMKVTRFFVGYGPTIWSFHRKGVEYGVKAIPAGAFVRIVGMTPQDDEVDPADEPRAMWRFPVWKRTIVMGSGAATHFLLGILILWGLFSFVPLEDSAKLQSEPVRVDRVYGCVDARWNSACTPGTDPASPASQVGLRPGDVITEVDGSPVAGWDALTAKVRAAGGQRLDHHLPARRPDGHRRGDPADGGAGQARGAQRSKKDSRLDYGGRPGAGRLVRDNAGRAHQHGRPDRGRRQGVGPDR